MFQVAPSLTVFQQSLPQYLLSLPESSRPVKVVVGVLIFSPKPSVLLLQRSATERVYPNLWELPSGKVELDDETLLHAAARECKEETGLEVTEFTAAAESFEYTIEGRGRTLQLNFLANVRDVEEVAVSEEHQAFGWYSEEEIKEVGVTEATRGILTDGFTKLSA
jgi:8-oxo-dGTP pyrophosphatase MutT (NUDIX family)